MDPRRHAKSERIKREVEAGYDAMAGRYLAGKDPKDVATLSALEDLAKRLPGGASVLDLGCGAGVPATRWLSERFEVTGVDISTRQLELARRNAPKAKLVRSGMTAFDAAPGSFGAVVALLSIIHVPREEHPALFRNIFRWLEPGGYFLGVLSVGEWEGFDPDWEGWGAGMWWSHHDAGTNLEMLQTSGFEVVREETKSGKGTVSAAETWLRVLARRPRNL